MTMMLIMMMMIMTVLTSKVIVYELYTIQDDNLAKKNNIHVLYLYLIEKYNF
jgi:hypothetical protein